jgi:hypothetical protein
MATRYRDLQGPVSLQTGLVDNSAARAASSLAQSFSEFENTGFTLGGELRQQQGAAEGEAAGAAGTPAPRSGLAAATRYGAAYNGAAEVSYANKVAIDVADQLERIEREAETDPILYGEKTRGLMEGTLGDAPPEWRARLEQHLTPRVMAGAARVARASDTKRKQETLADYLAAEPVAISQLVKTLRELPGEAGDAELARVMGERQAQIDALVADNILDPVQAEKMRQDFTGKVDEALSADRTGALVEELVATGRSDVEAADDLLMSLDAREDLTLEEKTAIRSAYREQSELLRFERTRMHMDELADLSRRLASGQFSGIRAEAGRLYRRGALSPSEYEQYVAAAERNRQAEIEKDADKEAAEVIDFMDPGNPDHQKAAEQYFSDTVKATGMKPGDERWQTFAINMVNKKNILPKSAESWARVALISGDPIAATNAAVFMDRVKGAKDGAYAWNHEPKVEALAETLRANMAAGMDPMQAHEIARKTTIDMKPTEREIRETAYKALVKKDPNVNALGDLLNDGRSFFRAAGPRLDPPPGAQAEFEDLVRQYYLATDDITTARKLAADKVKSRWGVTQVNGKREITKYPVERHGLSPEIVRADIALLVEPLGIDPASVRLIPAANGATDRTQGVQWNLGYVDETGMPDVVRGANGLPRSYRLPLGGGFAEAREAVRRKNLARARVEREAEEKAEIERRATMGATSLTPGLR